MIAAILEALVSYLGRVLVTEAGDDDLARPAEVKIGPLQDDPTRVSPFVLVAHHPQKRSQPGWVGHGPAGVGNLVAEVGPGSLWTHWFSIRVTAYAASQAEALAAIGALWPRLYEALRENPSLDGLCAASGQRVERVAAFEDAVVDGFGSRVHGGQNDWFGDLEIDVHYHTEIV